MMGGALLELTETQARSRRPLLFSPLIVLLIPARAPLRVGQKDGEGLWGSQAEMRQERGSLGKMLRPRGGVWRAVSWDPAPAKAWPHANSKVTHVFIVL